MIFVGVNENSTTFLYTLNRRDKKTFFQKWKKVFLSSLFKACKKIEMSATKKFGFQFQFLVSIYPTNRIFNTKLVKTQLNLNFEANEHTECVET